MRVFCVACILITGLVFFSCTHNGNDGKIRFGRTQELLPSDSVNLESYEVYNPEHIVAFNDSLWIVEGEGVSERLYLLDGAGRYVAKGIGVGQGPGEVLEITSIHRTSCRTVIYDARKGMLSELRYKDGAVGLVPLMSRLPLLDDACLLSDGRVLVVPVIGNYSYALLDGQGNVRDSLRYYPPKPDNRSDFVHSLACTGEMAVSGAGKRFARTLVYDGAIDFFDSDNDSLIHIRRQEEFGMDYDVITMVQPVPTFANTTRIGYRSLTASDNLFYALFSDRLVLESEGDGCDEIQAFTSDGLPYCRYLLDRKLAGIAVKSDNSVIYGLGTVNGGEAVCLYIYRLGNRHSDN